MTLKHALSGAGVALVAVCAICSGQASDTGESKPLPRSATTIPAGMSQQDIEWYARILELSDPQREFCKHLLASYDESRKATLVHSHDELDGLAIEAGAASSDGPSPATAAAFEAFWNCQGKLKSELASLDDALFQQLETALTETQLERMPRVRQSRVRARCFPFYTLVQPAEIDLSRLVQEAKLDDELLTQLDGELQEYENRATPLFLQASESNAKSAVTLSWARIDAEYDTKGNRYPEGSAEGAQAVALYLQRVRTANSEYARMLRHLVDLNQQYIVILANALPDAHGGNLDFEYKRRAFPSVYPDRSYPASLLLKLVEVESLNDEESDSLESIIDTYKSRYKSICAAMEEELLSCRLEIEHTSTHSSYSAHRDKMRGWREDRWKLTGSFLAQLVETFGAKLGEDRLALIEGAQDQLATMQSQGESDSYPN